MEDEHLLCTGPGTLLRLTVSDLKLTSNLSDEMFYTSALPIQACRSISQVPILVSGPNCGDVTLGNLSLAVGEGLNLLCKLSLSIEVVYWESNVYASSGDMQQVVLVSPSAFILVQIEQTQTMRQLTQSIPPPNAHDSWAGGFFMPENQLLVFTTGGSSYHYSWDAAGGLTRIGETTPTEAPQLAATRFTSLFWLNKDYLINVLPGNSQIIATRIDLPAASSANTLTREWQQQLPKPGDVNSGVVTALTPIYLETESDPEPRPWVAKGFRDGTIRVVPLAQIFDRSEKGATHLLTSQGYAITCLHQPSGVGKKQLLMSGDASGGIRLWELSSWVRLASFQGHGQPIGTFFQLPNMPPDQPLVFGLAQDASISIFCLKRMVCLGLIPGHRAPVSQVVCYPEAVLEVAYSDGHHTYWILHPNGVRIWTEKVTVPRSCGVQLTRMRSPSIRADIACYPAWDMQHPFPVLQVFDINVRSLLRSMNSSIEPVVRLLTQAKNLPTPGEASRRTSILPEDSQPSSDSSLKLSKIVFYALLTKDTDVSDILCDTLDPSANQLLIGLRGAGSKITFMLHGSNACKQSKAEVWKISPYATASRLLPSIVMAKACHTHEGNESKAIAVLTNYGCLLPELVGEAFQFPCLGYMAKFWQDPSPDVQSAARSLLLSLFSQLGSTRQRQLVDQWVTLLPQTVPVGLIHLKGSGLAVVVLGIILVHYSNLISDVAVRGRIARSLEWFISNHARPNFRLSAIQIVSSNFQHFEAHVDGVWILRSLYGAYHEQGRHMQLVSQQAVLQLALANTPLFITSLGLAKGIHQLSAIMQLISFLVQNSQSLMLPYIPRVIEVIVKSLHPRDAEQRQSLISPATQCLHDLVAAYSMVDFHPGSQRLAVGVMEGAAIVYDLYTSTRCLVVEGYHSPVSAVAFSPDGKFLATFSAQESLLKIWNSAGGLFDMLAKTFRGHTPAAVPASKARSHRAVNSMYLSLPSTSDAAPTSAPTSGRTSPRSLAPPREYSGSVSGSSSPLGLFSSSPAPYRTFNTSLGNSDSAGSHLIDLRFSGDRSLLLMANDISLVFNI
ncbi:hypothetical protein DSO57_1005972 [Entomophthora muscae]|uniref:Uncharacterized protein n=1 Tax=Entomophthora muscae TaxID=34485 RepID=A0ACC2TVI2_9FUNG|nr:hypothetical protein DSO57_1005972 [Entomophthora muscae]